MISAFSTLAALLLDALFGEVKRWHPLVGFGRWAKRVEGWLYRRTELAGVLALALTVLPFVLLATTVQNTVVAPYATAILLYFAVGWRSLGQHAEPIATALRAHNIEAARHHLSRIVSRDTADIDEAGISRATVESVLENGCDAIFGAIFWALLAGAPGVVLYRLVNTLDAMWGYKNTRYLKFGWAAARLDDALNFVPARLTALSYALAGNTARALHCWRLQGGHWKSPNAGPVMAAGAGALGVLLGGSARYHGTTQARPLLGEGPAPDATDITRSLRLVDRALLLWLLVIVTLVFPSHLFL